MFPTSRGDSGKQSFPGRLLTSFEGDNSGLRDQSRSGCDQSLVSKLVYYGFTFEQVDAIMRKARIGKCIRAPHAYKAKTYGVAGWLLFCCSQS